MSPKITPKEQYIQVNTKLMFEVLRAYEYDLYDFFYKTSEGYAKVTNPVHLVERMQNAEVYIKQSEVLWP